jgi:hypothetical protein
MNEIIVKWNQIYIRGIIVQTIIKINTLLVEDDQVTKLTQRTIYREKCSQLHNIAKHFGMEISTNNLKRWHF